MAPIIQQLIEELVSEALRGFNFGAFKTLQDSQARVEYAKKHLPLLGAGSSRTTFAYSGGKVLKIAMTPAGVAQNETELEVFTNPKTKPIITTIYDAAPDNSWILSQIVKPIKSPGEWQDAVGMSFNAFSDIIGEWLHDGKHMDILEYCQMKIDNMNATISKLEQSNRSSFANITKKTLANFTTFVKIPLGPAVCDLIKKNGLLKSDLIGGFSFEHYGTTVDGKVVVLDYGLNLDVMKTHYNIDD